MGALVRFYRFNLDTNAEYELLRAGVDAVFGYLPPSTSISPYSSAPVDQKGRVVLNLIDSTPGYGLLVAGADLLVMAGKAKELTQDEYDASFFPAPSAGGGGGVSSWNDLADKPSEFPPSAHAHGNITSDGKIGSLENVILATATDGVIQTLSIGAGLMNSGGSLATDLAAVAATGSYSDLTNKPTIPSITSGTAIPTGGIDGDIYLQHPG